MGRAPCLRPAGNRSGQIVSLLILLVVCFAFRLAIAGNEPISLYAAIGGFEGALALAVFYRALAMGAMGLTAALTGLLMTALVPVVFELVPVRLARNDHLVGLAVGLVADLADLAHSPATEGAGTPRQRIAASGAIAGIGFGAQLDPV